ncbi:MAG: MFS transporter [Actinomycetota bacterium]|nr:MFS transporter [Actinomycetota bacterium]
MTTRLGRIALGRIALDRIALGRIALGRIALGRIALGRIALERIALDVSPVRASRGFRNLLVGDAVSVIGSQVTLVAVPLQVYELTHSAAAVGLVGLAGLVPLVLLGLYGGAVADAVDRRRLVLLTTVGQAALSGVLLAQALAGLHAVWLLYLVVAASSGLFALESPARQAFVPRLLPVALLPAANALRQVEFNVGVTVGPLLAGVLVGRYGFGAAYGVDLVSYAASLLAVAALPAMSPEGGGRRAGLTSVVEGLRFLRSRPVLLTTFVVDLVAMIFAMPRAVFPSLAQHTFHGGEQTAGLLYSALAAGALLGALGGGWLGRVHRQGRAVVLAIVGWGVAISAFGLTSDLWLALLLLALAGAADMVSAVFRGAILQAAAPDELRGRLGGVYIVVVAGGPRLGDARVGGSAALVGVPGAVVGGGLAVVVLTLAVASRVPRFLAYDARDPQP